VRPTAQLVDPCFSTDEPKILELVEADNDPSRNQFQAHENFFDNKDLTRPKTKEPAARGSRRAQTAVIPAWIVGRFLPETPALRGSSGRRLRASSENGKTLTLSTTAGLQLDKFGKLIVLSDGFLYRLVKKHGFSGDGKA
jgi:hypothetical protein